MKRPLKYIVLFLLIIIPFTQSQAQNRQRFDGGMMVHTGYLHGDLTALNHKAEGMTFGSAEYSVTILAIISVWVVKAM